MQISFLTVASSVLTANTRSLAALMGPNERPEKGPQKSFEFELIS